MTQIAETAEKLKQIIETPNATVFIVIGSEAEELKAPQLISLVNGDTGDFGNFHRMVVQAIPAHIVDDPVLDHNLRNGARVHADSSCLAAVTGQRSNQCVWVMRPEDEVRRLRVITGWFTGDSA